MFFKNKYCLIIFIFVFCFFALNKVEAVTNVGGEIKYSTTWTKANSPYEIYKTVEIPRGVRLTIEPGAVVRSALGGGNMFSLLGEIIAEGTIDDIITIDGNGGANFIDASGSNVLAHASLKYCNIINGGKFWNNGVGTFNLEDSILDNWSIFSYVYYPAGNINISSNIITNSAGFSFGVGKNSIVNISNNSWTGKRADTPSYEDYFIKNWAAYENGRVVVENNTFSVEDGIILRFDSGLNPLDMDATNNFWGTSDLQKIADSIYDSVDNKAISETIEFEPILENPDSETSGTETAVPAPQMPSLEGPAVIDTTKETIILSGNKTASTSLVFNGEEIIPLNDSTFWEYEFMLEMGENYINITSKNFDGLESEVLEIIVNREAEKCEIINYGDWGNCVKGKQTRIIESKTPTDCLVSNPVLEQSCKVDQNISDVVDLNLSKRLAGKILLQVESKGEAWYVNPLNLKKYYLGRPADAFTIMRDLGLGATHEYIVQNSTAYPSSVLGRILIDVEKNGEAYYINPVDKKAYYLGRPLDAFNVMRDMGLGITNENLAKIKTHQ